MFYKPADRPIATHRLALTLDNKKKGERGQTKPDLFKILYKYRRKVKETFFHASFCIIFTRFVKFFEAFELFKPDFGFDFSRLERKRGKVEKFPPLTKDPRQIKSKTMKSLSFADVKYN